MRAGRAAIAGIGLLCASAAACGHAGSEDARFPKRPDGCEVTLFPETPQVPTENIGPVHAACDEDVAPDDCLRTLKDAVCALGGDVVWGVGEPERRAGKIHYDGRAAHRKARRSRPAAP